jgi:sphinganine C4-monooxygenase
VIPFSTSLAICQICLSSLNFHLCQSFTLQPAPSLIKGVPDLYLTVSLPIIAYWGWGLMFFYFDKYNQFERYRLHTPAEIKKRNLVPIAEVVPCVVIQQIWQILLGVWFYPGPDLTGKEDYEIAIWATRVRLVQRYVPLALAALGLDSMTVAKKIGPHLPILAGILNGGGTYVDGFIKLDELQTQAPVFLVWETFLAKAIYYWLVPALQFGVAIFVGDTWQYLLHRVSHQIGWIYSIYPFLTI